MSNWLYVGYVELVRRLAVRQGGRPRGSPSCRGPDLDARRRVQNRHQDPDHRRRRSSVSHLRTPGRLRRTGPSHPGIRLLDQGETRSQRGNHAPKSALFLSAFAGLSDPTNRAYHDRKRAQGKRHNAAPSAWPAASTSCSPCCATAPPYRASITTEPTPTASAA